MRVPRVSFVVVVVVAVAVAIGAGGGCIDNDIPDATPEEKALAGVKDYVTENVVELHAAAIDLQNAAPAADADGWNASDDAAALASMRASWRDARGAYERVEGAIAVLFPDLDVSTDARYDAFLGELGGDDDLFDGDGVTGVHAIERILFADRIPAAVVTFESGIPGYVAARFPATQEEAQAFKASLCQRLVDDTQQMVDELEPLALDTSSAYRGVIGSMGEQFEKLELSGEGQDESRYAQTTLFDMRNNLEGGRAIFDEFEPMFDDTDGGEELETHVKAQMADVKTAYDAVDGDALPPVPADWNPDAPTPDQLASPYGKLFTFLRTQTNADDGASLVSQMAAGADLLGIPQL